MTSGELSDYDEHKSDRARDRAATAISFAVSAGLFITGAFLHQLDRPSSEQVSRAGSDRSDNRFVPVALPGGAGAFFQGAF